jgi:hypothetical protein
MTSLASDGKQNKLKIDSFDSTKSLTGDLSDGDRAGATPLLLIDVGDDASRSSQPENSDDGVCLSSLYHCTIQGARHGNTVHVPHDNLRILNVLFVCLSRWAI